jgi:hypothetical protein
MIIWGGLSSGGFLNDGGRFNPAVNIWSSLALVNAPQPRANHTAVWTGTEMIVWGGVLAVNTYTNDGSRFDPTANIWRPLPPSSASVRELHLAVWTGSEMLVWGGYLGGATGYRPDGARYNLAANNWTDMVIPSPPAGRASSSAVWTGTEMLIFGGNGAGKYFGETFSYKPPLTATLYLYARP